MNPDNLKAGKKFGLSNGFNVCTGERYLGSFIGDDDSKRNWLKKRTETWDRNIHTVRKTAGKYTQESYYVVVRVIQSEWIFQQLVINNMGDAFAGVYNMLQENFLPHFFFVK